jgi:hypothetical protein
MLALVVILLLLLGWALIAGRLARYSVTAPLALLVAGVVLTAGQDPVFIFDIEFKAAEQIVEVILAILLFTDATEVPGCTGPRAAAHPPAPPDRPPARSSWHGWSAPFSSTA